MNIHQTNMIRAELMRQGLSMADVARQIGITRSAVYRVVSGEARSETVERKKTNRRGVSLIDCKIKTNPKMTTFHFWPFRGKSAKKPKTFSFVKGNRTALGFLKTNNIYRF